MAHKKDANKRVRVTITKEDYEKLSRLAQETSRALPGYLRWPPHNDFRAESKK